MVTFLTDPAIKFYYELVLLICMFLSFTFCFWYLSRKDLKNNTIFDIVFISLIGAFCVSRAFGIVSNFSHYASLEWSFLPLDYSDDLYFTFDKNPWSLLRFWDGHFVFGGVFLGLLLALFLVYLNSNQKKNFPLLLNRIIFSYLISFTILVSGLLILSLLDFRITHPVFFILDPFLSNTVLNMIVFIYLIAAIVGYFLLHTRLHSEKLTAGLFILSFGLLNFVLRFYLSDYSPTLFSLMNNNQLAWLVIVIIALMLLLDPSKLRSPLKTLKEATTNRLHVIKERERIEGDRESAVSGRRGFAMSFSNFKRDWNLSKKIRTRSFRKKGEE